MKGDHDQFVAQATRDRLACSVPGCGHVHDVECLLMSIASGGVRRVAHQRRVAPYGMPGVEIIDEAFHEQPGLWAELQTTVARLSRSAGSSSAGAGKASETPVPYHARASAVAHRLRNELSTWARALAGERLDLDLPADYPPAIARWLAEELAGSFVAGELADSIRDVVRAAQRVIDHGPDRMFVGRCETALTEDGRRQLAVDPDADVPRCQADVYARRDKGFVPCRACGAMHDVAYRKTWLEQHLAGSMVTAGEAAPYLSWLTDKEIKVDTIHKWRTRAGRLESVSDAAGRRLYRFRDLLALAQEVRTRQAGPRGKEGSAA